MDFDARTATVVAKGVDAPALVSAVEAVAGGRYRARAK